MPAFLETVGDGIYILRAGPKAVAYGDPFTASGTVVAVGVGACEVRGFTRRSDDHSGAMKMLHDTQRCLRNAGFTSFQWERMRDGRSRKIMVGTDGY